MCALRARWMCVRRVVMNSKRDTQHRCVSVARVSHFVFTLRVYRQRNVGQLMPVEWGMEWIRFFMLLFTKFTLFKNDGIFLRFARANARIRLWGKNRNAFSIFRIKAYRQIIHMDHANRALLCKLFCFYNSYSKHFRTDATQSKRHLPSLLIHIIYSLFKLIAECNLWW